MRTLARIALALFVSILTVVTVVGCSPGTPSWK
jgi:hypothetical protein